MSKSPSADQTTAFISLDRDLRLIDTVRQHEVIYDPRYTGYKDPRVKDSTWKLIGEEVGAKPDDCRNRWRSLRDRFVREKKALILGEKNGSSARRSKPWRLLEPMTFLWEFIMHRSRRGVTGESTWITSLTDEQLVKLETEQSQDQESQDQGGCFEWIAVGDEDENTGDEPPQKRLREDDSSSHSMPVVSSASSLVVSQLQISPHETLHEHEEGDCEDTLFCKSVAHTLRRLVPRRKALAKLRILQALYDAEFGSDVGPDVEVKFRNNNVTNSKNDSTN